MQTVMILTTFLALFLAVLFLGAGVLLTRQVDEAKRKNLESQDHIESLVIDLQSEKQLKNDYRELLKTEEDRVTFFRNKAKQEQDFCKAAEKETSEAKEKLQDTEEELARQIELVGSVTVSRDEWRKLATEKAAALQEMTAEKDRWREEFGTMRDEAIARWERIQKLQTEVNQLADGKAVALQNLQAHRDEVVKLQRINRVIAENSAKVQTKLESLQKKLKGSKKAKGSN